MRSYALELNLTRGSTLASAAEDARWVEQLTVPPKPDLPSTPAARGHRFADVTDIADSGPGSP
jgi:hypothetical protein